MSNKIDPFFKDSIIGRVFRGFFDELDIYPQDRINDDYINSLIQRESESLALYGKLFKSLLILNSISLLLIQGELC